MVCLFKKAMKSIILINESLLERLNNNEKDIGIRKCVCSC